MKRNHTLHFQPTLILKSIFLLVLGILSPFITFSQSLSAANYPQWVQQADQALQAKDYASALYFYERANLSQPDQKLPDQKIADINKTIDATPDLRSQLVENSIISGENFYNKHNYPEAKKEYLKAIALDPSAQFAKDRLEQISSVYTDPADQMYFDNAIKTGDNALAVNNFEKAIQQYAMAQSVKSNSKLPKEKIANAQKLQADYSTRKQQADKIIAGADKLYGQNKQKEALAEYQKAYELIPSNTHVNQRIQEIKSRLAELANKQQSYDVIVADADQFYMNREFSRARLRYEDALKVRPEARYPKEMIEKSKLGESQLANDQQRYDAAIASGEANLKGKIYENALGNFKEALSIKPAETYPKTKISEIEQILSQLLSHKETYAFAIKNADNAFDNNNLSDAEKYYKQALALMPNENYPKNRLEEISQIRLKQLNENEAYAKLIADADKLMLASDFEKAIAVYQQALAQRPSDTYPAQRITEAKAQLEAISNREESYKQAIANGDNFSKQKQWEDALASYNQALTFKPNEAYPKAKVSEINALLSKEKTDAELYKQNISFADKAFEISDFQIASKYYQQALDIRPYEQYPKEKLSEIIKKIGEQKVLDEKYALLIGKADKALENNTLSDALKLYNEASVLKPAESYPKTKIAEINQTLADRRNLEEAYATAIANADQLVKAENWEKALESYQRALSLKPAEKYPIAQLAMIKAKMEAIGQLNAQYQKLITAADQQFKEEKYTECIAGYKNALQLKPKETYPADQITLAEQQVSALRSLNEQYAKAVADGDANFKKAAYEPALTAYNEAARLKPAETYPKSKIAEIQQIVGKINAENQQYADIIAKADNLFNQKDYTQAKTVYQEAIAVKPAEKYPIEQIKKIEAELLAQKKTDEQYQLFMTEAQKNLDARQYLPAREGFVKASGLKPYETLPKTKIAEIDNTLATIKLADENYAKAMADADNFYKAGNWEQAVNSFKTALGIKPNEIYPQERITAIEAEIKLRDKKYADAIALGDQNFRAKKLPEALNAYQQALDIKSGQEYPQQKMAEINQLLQAMKEELDRMYAGYIAEGDKLLETKELSNARTEYNKAIAVKPNEQYPKQKVAEINKQLEAIELAKRTEYNKAAGEADNLYRAKVFDQAIEAYEVAAKILPTESYPEMQIAKIRKYLADHAIQDLSTTLTLIKQGDEKKFTFKPVELRQRKNSYIVLRARSTGNISPKIYLNYGRDAAKNGGIVLYNINKTTAGEYLIRISAQDKWYREDNNWISLYVETGSLEISKIQLTTADE